MKKTGNKKAGSSGHPLLPSFSLSRGKMESSVVLLPVHPYLIHAYWDLPPDKLAQMKKREGKRMRGARPVLRFFDVTDIVFDGRNARHTFDIPVDLAAGNWYVHLWIPGRSYCVDLGFQMEDGRFVRIARSNIAETPPVSPAPEAEKPEVPSETGGLVSPVEDEQKTEGAFRMKPDDAKEELPVSEDAELGREADGAGSKKFFPAPGPQSGSAATKRSDATQIAEEDFIFGLSSPFSGLKSAAAQKKVKSGGRR